MKQVFHRSIVGFNFQLQNMRDELSPIVVKMAGEFSVVACKSWKLLHLGLHTVRLTCKLQCSSQGIGIFKNTNIEIKKISESQRSITIEVSGRNIAFSKNPVVTEDTLLWMTFSDIISLSRDCSSFFSLLSILEEVCSRELFGTDSCFSSHGLIGFSTEKRSRNQWWIQDYYKTQTLYFDFKTNQ